MKENTRWVRTWIVILTVVDCGISAYLPPVSNAIAWTTSWMIPMTLMFVIGMLYKRSNFSAIFTILLCWLINVLLSVTPLLSVLHIDGVNYSIVMIIVTLVVGFVTTALDRKAKPAFIKVYKKQRAEWDAEQHLAATN
jgi:uncharacterized protein YacL